MPSKFYPFNLDHAPPILLHQSFAGLTTIALFPLISLFFFATSLLICISATMAIVFSTLRCRRGIHVAKEHFAMRKNVKAKEQEPDVAIRSPHYCNDSYDLRDLSYEDDGEQQKAKTQIYDVSDSSYSQLGASKVSTSTRSHRKDLADLESGVVDPCYYTSSSSTIPPR